MQVCRTHMWLYTTKKKNSFSHIHWWPLSSVGGWNTNHLKADVSLLFLGPWSTTWRSPWSQPWCCCLSCFGLQRCTTSWVLSSWQLCPDWSSGTTMPLTERRGAPSSSSLLHSTLWPTCITFSSQRFYHTETSPSCRCALWPLGWFLLLFLLFTPREAQDLWPLPCMNYTARVRGLKMTPHRLLDLYIQQAHPLQGLQQNCRQQKRPRQQNGLSVLFAK